MTPKQVGLLKFITRYIDQNGVSPSYDDICKALFLKSRSGVGQMLQALADANMITFIPRRSRSIQLVPPITRELAAILREFEADQISSEQVVMAVRKITLNALDVK